MEELFHLLQSNLHYAAAEKPSTVGEAERFIKTFCEGLEQMAHLDRLTWDTYIHPVLYGYRTQINSVTKHTPQELVFGMSVRTVESLANFGAILGDVRHDTLKQTWEKVHAFYDSRPEFYTFLKRNLQELPQFDIGNKVLLSKAPQALFNFGNFINAGSVLSRSLENFATITTCSLTVLCTPSERILFTPHDSNLSLLHLRCSAGGVS
jgi:hypothetical protein